MNRIPVAASVALCGLFLTANPTLARAECTNGNTGACSRNGCAGVRECVNGRWIGCEVPDECLVPRPPLPVDRVVVEVVVPGEEVGILYDGANAQGPFNDRSTIADECPYLINGGWIG